ncbi:Trypsin inhibitor [Melia azedarach]|uniref:Trypsin inhibitor n=1 Tax=Melia azedarach TaxID=155640 RepID=A0ACC1XSI8_MELAZ|nr:Trypsin inhibitor [Melia azedarach]
MKISSLVTLLSFLLIAFATKPLLAQDAHRQAAHHHQPLIDTDGNKVESTLDYYVVSVIRGAGGGGLSLFPRRNGLCPLDVRQEGSDLQRGVKIRFSPVDKSAIVRESTDLNVRFVTETRCNEPTVWKVDNYDDSRGKWFITTGGEEGNPGAQTLQSYFKLERIGSSPGTYKIVHCPSVCGSCVKLCSNVGIDYERSARRLVLATNEQRVFAVKLILAKQRSM